MNSRFIGNLSISPVGGAWRLNCPFAFFWTPIERCIVVPEGFIGDLASVPRILRPVVDDDDADIVEAAVIHDYLYSRAGQLPGLTLTRKQADEVLRDGMRSRGAPKLRADAVYWAVRVAGRVYWNAP